MNSLDSIPPQFLVAALVGGLIATIALLSIKRSLLALVALMLFVACTGTYEEYVGKTVRTVVQPISGNRSVIFVGLGAMIFAWILANWKSVNITRIPAQMLMLIVMGYYSSLIRFFHDGPFAGVASIAFASLTLIPLALALPAALDSRQRIILMFRFIALAGLLYVFACAVQFVVNQSAMLRPPQSRFSGVSGNPQSVAVSFSVFALVSLWLLLSDPWRQARLAWAGLFGASLVILLWTGSRTGVGMTVIGVSFAFYRRFGKLIFLAPVGLLVAYLAYGFLAGQGVEFVADRLVSTENTRAGSWRTQWAMFTSSPAIGVGTDDTKTENSYLYALAAFGLGMGILVLALAAVSAVVCLKLFLNRSRLPDDLKPVCDVTLAYNALYFAGGLLEGYMLARVGSHVIFMSIFAAIAAMLLRVARESTPAALPAYEPPEAFGEYADYGEPHQPGSGALSPA